MTANDMRAGFILRWDGARLANRYPNDREISAFLTQAQLYTVKKRVDKFKNRTQRGIGDGMVRASELGGLITSVKKMAKEYILNGNTNQKYNSGAISPFIVGTKDNGALRRPDLDNNINFSTGEPTSDHYGIFAPIPDEALYILTETCDLVKGNCQKFNIEVQEINYSDYNALIYNPWRNPYENLAWSLEWGGFTPASFNSGSGTFTDSTKDYVYIGGAYNMCGVSTQDNGGNIKYGTQRVRHLIAGKGWDVVGYYIHYVTTPPDIVVNVQTPSSQRNCVLADYLHDEIIDEAVKLAAAAIIPGEQKYQFADKQVKENE